MLRNERHRPMVVSIMVIWGLLCSAGCRHTSRARTASPDEEHAAVLAVLVSVACSEMSPLPPPEHRPPLAAGVRPVIVIHPSYVQPDDFILESATRSHLEEAVTALKVVSASRGDMSLSGARLPCNGQPVPDTKWNPRSWETFQEVYPGALAWMTVSRVGLSANGDIAYVYSHAQWGPLQGEGDIWVLARGTRSEWKVIHMYPVSRS
jgi:hypothetical protein